MESSRQLNIARIREKVSDIKEYLAVLHRYAEQEDAVFLANEEAILAARYSLIVLIEAAMNIANHFCARLLDKAPQTYSDAFLLLGEKKIIDSELAIRLAKMAKFRNLLVHGYAEIDNKKCCKSCAKICQM